MMNLSQNLQILLKDIENCARLAHRDPQSIQLILVSKTKPLDDILHLYTEGHRAFGENYAQELSEKAKACQDKAIQWHFLGHLQRNKLNMVLPYLHTLHSLDRFELANAMNSKLTTLQKSVEAFLEVKLNQDEHKTGIKPESLHTVITQMNALSQIQIKGLMMISSFPASSETIRHEMRTLKKLQDEINKKALYRVPLTDLSMGMSDDYKIAIEEGSTVLRIGSRVFGSRSIS